MSYVMPPQPTPKQQEYRKGLVERLKQRGMFIIDHNHKGAGTYGLLSPHGKMYIGKSAEYRKRMGSHRNDAYSKKKNGKWKENKYLYRALRKWGWDRFEKFIFQKHDERRADIDKILNAQEIALIAEFETFTDQSKGYNLTRGGEGTSGRKMTPEQLAAHTARKSTPEAKAAASERAKKKWDDAEFKEKTTVALKEAHNRPEVKAAHSAAMKKQWKDPEFRTKRSVALTEAQNRPEVKAKISAASKKLWQDPEYKKKTIAALTEAANRPEVKAKKRAALSKAVVSKQLISGENRIKEYQLRYHASRILAGENLSILFGMKFSDNRISSVISGKRKHHRGFFFENYTNAPGQPTPERPIKRMRVTNI